MKKLFLSTLIVFVIFISLSFTVYFAGWYIQEYHDARETFPLKSGMVITHTPAVKIEGMFDEEINRINWLDDYILCEAFPGLEIPDTHNSTFYLIDLENRVLYRSETAKGMDAFLTKMRMHISTDALLTVPEACKKQSQSTRINWGGVGANDSRFFQTSEALREVVRLLEGEYQSNGTFPKDLSDYYPDSLPLDAWGHPLQYRHGDASVDFSKEIYPDGLPMEGYELWSDGFPDGTIIYASDELKYSFLIDGYIRKKIDTDGIANSTNEEKTGFVIFGSIGE